MESRERKKEYGGFLPLELNPGAEWFAKYERVARFNSVKAALDAILRAERIRRIFVPYFYCPSTLAAIRRSGAEVTLYHIGADLQPLELPDEKDSAVLLVNYFGIQDEQTAKRAASFCRATVIADNAHAFFAPPLPSEKDYSVYSAKKFFGVPDGAYALGPKLAASADVSCAADYAHFLLLSYEQGTNAAYAEKKQVDALLDGRYGPMSALARGLLQNVDYERVRLRRKENFSLLRCAFHNENGLRLEKDCPAYLFPLYLEGRGAAYKSRLVREKIYVPTLWSGEELQNEGNDFERSLAEDTLFLPLDQRYDPKDIKEIIEAVKEIL